MGEIFHPAPISSWILLPIRNAEPAKGGMRSAFPPYNCFSSEIKNPWKAGGAALFRPKNSGKRDAES
jgi:hypothetical protein